MKGIRIGAVVLGMGLVLSGTVVFAQTNDAAPAAPSTPAVVIPEDQQASKEQLARLFEVMRIKQQMAGMTRAMPSMVQQQFQEQLQQMQQENPRMAMKSVMGKYTQRAMNLYGSDEMIADMTALYQKHLSRPDVESTIAFYSSPAGQHVLDMVPTIMQEFVPTVMQKTQNRMKPLILDMQKEMMAITTPGADKPSQK